MLLNEVQISKHVFFFVFSLVMLVVIMLVSLVTSLWFMPSQGGCQRLFH